jgi:hypothetical protein
MAAHHNHTDALLSHQPGRQSHALQSAATFIRAPLAKNTVRFSAKSGLRKTLERMAYLINQI